MNKKLKSIMAAKAISRAQAQAAIAAQAPLKNVQKECLQSSECATANRDQRGARSYPSAGS